MNFLKKLIVSLFVLLIIGAISFKTLSLFNPEIVTGERSASTGWQKILLSNIITSQLDDDVVNVDLQNANIINASLVSSTNLSVSNVTTTNLYVNGNVGIGTSSSAYSLSVSGTLYTDDFISKGPVVDVRAYGADDTGQADSTDAFRLAVAAASRGLGNSVGGSVYIPSGMYKITGTVTTTNIRVNIFGDGKQATMIRFNPTVDGTALFAFATSSGWFMAQNSIKKLGIVGGGDYQKIGILAIDTSEFTVEDVAMTAMNGNGSIGIQLRGRELTSLNRVAINADRPLVISDNPNSIIDADHLHVQDAYLIASSTNPIVTVDSGTNLTNVTFDGQQAWVKGGHGFYWVDTSTIAVSDNISLNNIRWEQSTNADGYLVDIEHNLALQNFNMNNVYGGVYTKGIKLRNIKWASLENVIYVGSSTAFDANTSTRPISFKNIFFQTGSTSTFGSLVKVLDAGQSNQGGTTYSFAIWDDPLSTKTFGLNKLSIGTNTPYASLAVLGSAGTNPVEIMSSTGSTLLRILQNGNVSVGTSTDVSPFHVAGSTGITWSANSSIPSGGLVTIGTGGTSGGSLWINTGSLTAGNGINSGLGIDGTYASTKSTIKLTAYGVKSAGYSGDLSFNTTNTSTITEVLRLTTGLSGNSPRVGINSSTPIATLAVQGSGGTNPLAIVSSTGSSLLTVLTNGNVGIGTASPSSKLDVPVSNGTLKFHDSTTAGGLWTIGNGVFGVGNVAYFAASGVNNLTLATGGTRDTFTYGTPRLTVLASNGNIGIGTTTPLSNLVIQGYGTSSPFTVVSSTSVGSMFTILQNGNVGVNTTSPINKFSVQGGVSMLDLGVNITGNGVCVTATGTITDSGAAACIPSAMKYKTNNSAYKGSAVELFKQLVNAGAVQNYELKAKLGDKRKGLIADIVEGVDKDLVGYSQDGSVNTLHFEDLTGLAVKAVAELEAKNIEQDQRIERLEKANKNVLPWHKDYWKLAFVAFVGLSVLGKLWKKLV